MKRKQKHYTTEEQILTKIDAVQARAAELNLRAELAESNAQQAIKMSQKLLDEWFGKSGKKAETELAKAKQLKNDFWTYKELARKSRKSARRIEETKLPLLGEALSEFRTMPILSITGNNLSVASAA